MADMQKKLLALRCRAGMNFGTDRARKLLDNLGSPDKKLRVIHVAGTNGKGAISQYISQILLANGEKVGTFTSPEIYSYYDMFQIDCEPRNISPELKIAYKLGKKAGATEFEIAFAAAMLAFFNAGCGYAVIECGMGGLSDATNAVAKKEVAVISSVSLEHTRFLGDSVRKICAQKYGIVKNCLAVISAHQNAEARAFFAEYMPTFAGEGIEITSQTLHGTAFEYGGEEYKLNTAGYVQPYNAACAIEAAKILGIGLPAIKRGLENTRLVGRIEVIEKGDKTYILDGGHNPAAIEPLARLLKGLDAEVIYGCLSDKDIDGVVSRLSAITPVICAVQPTSKRALSGTKIYETCKKYCGGATYGKSVAAALEKSRAGVVAICGSFTLLKEAKLWIEKRL